MGEGKLSNSFKFIVNSNRSLGQYKIILSGALSIPLGDFAKDTGNEGEGHAKTGFGFFGDINVPLGPRGLGWISSIAIAYNGYDKKLYQDLYSELGYSTDIDAAGYINIPVMTGISYVTNISSGLSYLNYAQIAFSFINGPDIKSGLTSIPFSGSQEISYDNATSFGFCLGTGLILNNMFALTVRYVNFGKPERNYTIETMLRDNVSLITVSSKDSYKENQSISLITINLGVML